MVARIFPKSSANNNNKKNYTHIYVYISAVKWLIAINRIQNKSFCLHNICACAVYIYYVYIHIDSDTEYSWSQKFTYNFQNLQKVDYFTK